MIDYQAQQREERKTKAYAAFQRWVNFLGLANYGYGVGVFDRLREATGAVREWRHASNTRGGDYEQEILAVRVVADTFASQIEAAATGDQDATTIAWVTAGLRCPAQPFCTGCTRCQTVTSPLRPNADPHRGPF